jgi:hypothetical protein
MAKKPPDRRDHDATMDLSVSQLVVDEQAIAAKQAPKPPPRGADNDMSLWAYRVVGSDDFAPVPAKPPRARTWLVVLLLVTLAGGGVMFGLYVL